MPLTIDEDAFSVNKTSTSLLAYVVDLSAFLAGFDVRSDEDAFPVNRLFKTLLEHVVDVSDFPAIADVVSDDDALLDNN